MRPFTATNGHDVPWLVDELVPGLAAVIDDVVVEGEDAVRQPVVANELPDILDRVEFGAFGRERDDADVGRHIEFSGHVPTRLIHSARPRESPMRRRAISRPDAATWFRPISCAGFLASMAAFRASPSSALCYRQYVGARGPVNSN